MSATVCGECLTTPAIDQRPGRPTRCRYCTDTLTAARNRRATARAEARRTDRNPYPEPETNWARI